MARTWPIPSSALCPGYLPTIHPCLITSGHTIARLRYRAIDGGVYADFRDIAAARRYCAEVLGCSEPVMGAPEVSQIIGSDDRTGWTPITR
jgi:hypothetical protein